MDDVVVNDVVGCLSVELSVPLEVLVSGVEYQLAPTVVDVDAEVVDLVLVTFAEAEVFVQTVFVARRDGVGQEEVELAQLNGEGSGGLAVALRCRYRVKSRCVNGDERRGLAIAPQIVRHRCDGIQRGGVCLAEVFRERFNDQSRVNDVQFQMDDTVAAELTLQLVGRGEVAFRNVDGLIGRNVESVSAELFTLADGLREGDVITRMDGQMQRDGGVAAVDGLQVLYIIASSRIYGVVPFVSVTTFIRKLCLRAVPNGQMQGYDGVATVAARQRLRVGAGSIVGDIVPYVRVAGLLRDGGALRMPYGQVQRDDGVATIVVRQRECRRVGGGRVCVSVNPREAVAGLSRVNRCAGLMDGQTHRDGGVATRRILQVRDLRARRSEYVVVPSNRQFVAANGAVNRDG